jgi:hypothetical protein
MVNQFSQGKPMAEEDNSSIVVAFPLLMQLW